MKFSLFSLFVFLTLFIHCKPSEKETSTATSETTEVKETEVKDPIMVGLFKIGDSDLENRLVVSYPITAYNFINSEEKKYAVSYVNKFKSDFRNPQQQSAKLITGIDLIQHFEVPFQNEDFISFLYTSYASTGNEYNQHQRAVMYDLKAQKKLAIENTFKDFAAFKAFAQKIKSIAKDSIIQRIENSNIFNKAKKEELKKTLEEKLTKGTEALQENYNAFYFTPGGYWHLFFKNSQIADTSLGSFLLNFSPEEVKPYLKEDLFTRLEASTLPISIKSLPLDQTHANDSIDCAHEKCIALTFNASPNNETQDILEVLEKHKIQATFFVVGDFAKNQPQLLKRILSHGNSIGNQSLTHRDFVRLTKEEALQEVEKTDSIIEFITGFRPHFFRFPYGTYSKEKVEKVNKPIIAFSYKIKDWTLEKDSLDSNEFKESEGIILEHDYNTLTTEKVESIIDSLQSKGFHFVTLEQMFRGKNLKKHQVYFSRSTE